MKNKWEEYERRKRQVANWIASGVDLDYEYEISRIVEQLGL